MSLLERAAGRLKPGVESMVAGGAAIITGAAIYLMPIELLQNAVLASGLADLLPPLDPPLGSKARIGLALVAAGFAFGLVALLVRLVLGRPKAKPFGRAVPKKAKAPKPSWPAAEEPNAPKLRWRDRHPDAPARAPLSIGREIGLPGEGAVPGFAKETRFVAPEPVIAEPEPVAFEPAVGEEPVAAIEPEASSAAPVEAMVEAVPELPDRPVATHPAWLDVDIPQPVERREPTLPELLERLEAAMARRPMVAIGKAAATAEPDVEPEMQPSELADDRLRSALENLKRFAPGRG